MILSEPEVLKTPSYYKKERWKKCVRLYDSVSKLFFVPFGSERSFRRAQVNFARPRAGERVLDACCGTGALTRLIAQRVGSSGEVIGVDLSGERLDIARKKTGGNSKFTFQQANCENLPFASDFFDKAFLSFGLHHMPQTARQNSLEEVYRTLKPGGSLFVLDYDLSSAAVVRLAIKAFVRLFEPEVAYRMLVNGTLTQEVEQAGFALGQKRPISGGAFQMLRADKPYSITDGFADSEESDRGLGKWRK